MTKRRGRGDGSVYQRPDGRWEGRIDLGWQDGKRHRKFVYGRTRAEVAGKVREALRERDEGTLVADSRVTVAEFLNSWLQTVKPTVRPSTWRRYEQYVRLHTLPKLGRVRLSVLKPQQLHALYADRLAAGASPQTVVHLHRTLHRALRQAVRWGVAGRNVAALVDPPRVERPEVMALSLEEARKVLRAAEGDRLEALYVLALTTGLRRGELLGLRWSDVDLEGGRLRVRRALRVNDEGKWVPGAPKTKRSQRPVLLTQMAVDALRRHRERQQGEREHAGELWKDPELVFTNTLGGHVWGEDLLKHHFYPLLDRAGVRRVRFHDLRHSTATLLLALGVHPKIVSEMLGHSRIGITLDLYSHVTETMQREAIDSLQAIFGSQNVSQKPSEDAQHEGEA